MNILFRLLLCILIVWTTIAQLFIVAIPLCLFYIYRYTGYELVVLAIIIDGYYAAFYRFPGLSLLVALLVISADFIKPHLLMYTKDDAFLS